MFNVQLEPTVTKSLVGRTRTELTGVGSEGSVANVAVTKNSEITQLQINHTTGTGGFTVDIFSDAALSDKVFSAISDESSAFFTLTKLGLDFQNTDSPQNNLCYMKITPNSGSGHIFKVALFYKKF